jgi:hypothetical protein
VGYDTTLGYYRIVPVQGSIDPYVLWKIRQVLYTVKRVDKVVRHPHLVTQDQFTQVSEKVFDIPAEDFTINIKLFLHSFTNVELVRQNWFDSKATSPGREPRFSDLLSDALPLRHTLFLIWEYIEEYKIRSGATSLLLALYSLLFICICICICIILYTQLLYLYL